MNTSHRGWLPRGRALLELLRKAWGEYERDYARLLAGAMVYYALVSLVPLLLLLLSALGLLLRYSAAAASAEQHVLSIVEARFGAELPAAIRQALDRLQQGSIVATGVSVAGLLATASVLFKRLRLSFRAMWKYEPPLMSGSVRRVVRATFREQAISFTMVLAGGALLLVSLALIAAVQWFGALFGGLPLLDDTAAMLLGVVGPLLIMTITAAFLFKFLPPFRLRWRHVRLAAVLCAAAWLLAGEMLALYARFVGDRHSAYGAIGGLLAIMLWMNVVSQLLFYGAELCKVIARHDDSLA